MNKLTDYLTANGWKADLEETKKGYFAELGKIAVNAYNQTFGRVDSAAELSGIRKEIKQYRGNISNLRNRLDRARKNGTLDFIALPGLGAPFDKAELRQYEEQLTTLIDQRNEILNWRKKVGI